MTRVVVTIAVLALLAVAGVELTQVAWLWHPLGACQGTPAQVTRCQSYNFWSGISGSNVTLPFAATAFALGWWHQHNCHEPQCWRLQWHPHPEHGHPVCKKHHPHDPKTLS